MPAPLTSRSSLSMLERQNLFVARVIPLDQRPMPQPDELLWLDHPGTAREPHSPTFVKRRGPNPSRAAGSASPAIRRLHGCASSLATVSRWMEISDFKRTRARIEPGRRLRFRGTGQGLGLATNAAKGSTAVALDLDRSIRIAARGRRCDRRRDRPPGSRRSRSEVRSARKHRARAHLELGST